MSLVIFQVLLALKGHFSGTKLGLNYLFVSLTWSRSSRGLLNLLTSPVQSTGKGLIFLNNPSMFLKCMHIHFCASFFNPPHCRNEAGR